MSQRACSSNYNGCFSCIDDGCSWDNNRGLCKDPADCDFNPQAPRAAAHSVGGSGPSFVCYTSKSQCGKATCADMTNPNSCQNNRDFKCSWNYSTYRCGMWVETNCLQYFNSNQCWKDPSCEWKRGECVLKGAGGGGNKFNCATAYTRSADCNADARCSWNRNRGACN